MTLYVAISFDFGPKNISVPFSISTHIGNFIMARRFYKNCTVYIFHRDSVADLAELDMIDFDVILGID